MCLEVGDDVDSGLEISMLVYITVEKTEKINSLERRSNRLIEMKYILIRRTKINL